MVSREDINTAVDKMILSASGWRGIFAVNGDEECALEKILPVHKIICASAAFIFAEYLKSLPSGCQNSKPLVLLGTDTRPTGRAIIDVMIPVLLSAGCEVVYAGLTAAPEIMAWARLFGSKNCAAGYIYISASHNPIGHNGLKFGLTDGGVLAADETEKLIASFREFIKKDDNIAKIEELIFNADPLQLKNVYAGIESAKAQAYKAYFDFCADVVYGGDSNLSSAMKDGLDKKPLGIVCDFNGSARTVSIDKDFFSIFGFKFESINNQPGQIAHRIVPEGESLEPCCILLEETRKSDVSFVLGYVPDCDGDRGNLVIWDDKINKARALEAQEVFALACVAEFSHLVWTKSFVPGDLSAGKAAVAVNDPTSMRIDKIAECFGIRTFRAEVGEANVVSLARKLREEGYIVRILGEGSAGGNITHPSAVRDPINTVLAIAKMLSVRSLNGKEGLFEIWCKYSGQIEKYHSNFTVADIIASLPPFVSTPAYSKDAVLRINTQDHVLLKERYQQIFLREWEERKNILKTRYGIYNWDVIAYNGMTERRGIKSFGEAKKGGLKILFFNEKGKEIAYIWMRGSATEPVFRIMADVEGSDINIERFLLDWQRQMIIKADRS